MVSIHHSEHDVRSRQLPVQRDIYIGAAAAAAAASAVTTATAAATASAIGNSFCHRRDVQWLSQLRGGRPERLVRNADHSRLPKSFSYRARPLGVAGQQSAP